MTERNGNGGNLTIAIIIALIVGVVVYFLMDTTPVGEIHTPTTTTGTMLSGATTGG